MQKLTGLFAFILTLSFTVPASAKPPTKTQKSEFRTLISSGHITAAELKKFLRVNRPGTKAPAARPAVKNPPPLEPIDAYKVTIRCDLTDAIAAGKYHKVGKEFTPKNFMPNPDCKDEAEAIVYLFSFPRAKREDAVKKMHKAGYRPANLFELLAFGAAQPELQRLYDVSALNSGWWKRDEGLELCSPLLGGMNAERTLVLKCMSSSYIWPFPILGVRKSAL